MTFRLAIRNLARQRLRTLLTTGGVAVSVALLIWLSGLMDGMFALMLDSATETQLGDAQVHTQAYVDEPSMYESFSVAPEFLASLEEVPGVRAVAPRAQSFGMLGHEKTSQIAQIKGIQPQREARVTTAHETLVKGSWLEAAKDNLNAQPVVLGEGLAKQLNVDIGDELVVILQGVDGSMGNGILVVGGIFKSGNTSLDRQVAFVRLSELQRLLALDDRVMEIAATFTDMADVTATTRRLQTELPAGLQARSWREIVPSLAQMIEMSQGSTSVLYIIVYFLAGLGVLNTQRMSALERRKEFGVMMAVGLTPRRLATTIIFETLLLVSLGGLVGTGIGALLNFYFSRAGLDFTGGGETFSFAGVSFGEPIYFTMRPEHFVWPAVALLVVGVLCALWPALSSARLDPIRALSGRGG